MSGLWWHRFFSATPPPISLETEHLLLSPPRVDAYEAWASVMRANADILRARQPTWPKGHLTQAQYQRRLRLYELERARGTGFAFHIFERAGDPERLIGWIRLAPIHYGAARSSTVGYWICHSATGRGYATSALHAVRNFAFSRLNLARLEAYCLPDNAASARVLRKSGFEKEGCARGYLAIDGVRRDHDLWGCLARSVQGNLSCP